MDTNCLVKVIDFMKGDCIKSFQIKGVNSYNEILASILSPNDNYYFVIDNGVYKLNLNNGNVENIILFKEKTKKVIISDDCKDAVVTDFINFFINCTGHKM